MSKKRTNSESPIVDMRRAEDSEKKPPCWLVWSLQTSGLTSLRAIDTSPKNAQIHRRMCASENGVIKAWIEMRDMNHLYGHNDVTQFSMVDYKAG